jgi:Ca-activated chloride channel family protein
VLVTDGVANMGEVDPARFHAMMKQFDVRVFGFLLGNSANWPLMRAVCDASGGFYAPVSTGDDLIGQILLAKSKLTSEALHDAKIEVTGGTVNVFDTGEEIPRKIFRGQQLVLFGRYDRGGPATVTLHAKLTGRDEVYRTSFNFPEVEASNPEIERLWAMSRIEDARRKIARGDMPPSAGESIIRDLGVQFSLVTEQTSMVVMSDDAFASREIARRNLFRTAGEQQAQATRAAQPARDLRVDRQQPAFTRQAPAVGSPRNGGGGGGAIDPLSGAFVLLVAGATIAVMRRRKPVLSLSDRTDE